MSFDSTPSGSDRLPWLVGTRLGAATRALLLRAGCGELGTLAADVPVACCCRLNADENSCSTLGRFGVGPGVVRFCWAYRLTIGVFTAGWCDAFEISKKMRKIT